MSIERRGKHRWRVRWLQAGEHRSRTFDSYREAQLFDLRMKREKLEGRITSAPRITLAEYADRHWFPEYVDRRLAEATRRNYRDVWSRHIAPPERDGNGNALRDSDGRLRVRADALGRRRLREMSPRVVRDFVHELEQQQTGPAMTYKALMTLSSCLAYAVEEDALSENPVRVVRKPAVRRGRRIVRPVAPEGVERLRAALLDDTRWGQRDAFLVSVLAYVGLRPGEALALRFSAFREHTVVVETSLSFGIEKDTKTGGARTPTLFQVVSEEKERFRAALGARQTGLVFARADGDPWRETDYRNWRRRVFQPAAEAVGLPGTNPYHLRHSWASLLLRSPAFHGDPARIARMAGHSLETFFRVYAHEIQELQGEPLEEPEAVIRAARVAASGQLRLAGS